MFSEMVSSLYKRKDPMTSMIERKSVYETSIESVSSYPSAISFLANCNNCGLAMLVDKLLSQDTANQGRQQLITTLINRFHYNSVAVLPSSNDAPENFILDLLEKAVYFSHTRNGTYASLELASRFLTRSVSEFENGKSNEETLEHHWNEFLFHFYRSKLK